MRTHQPSVLVVYKKDAYEQYIREQRDSRLIRLLRQRHPDVVDMQRAHVVHQDALDAIVQALRGLGVQFEVAYRAELKGRGRYHLVVSVGGDGTFLQAARAAKHTPVLGVNSDPARSEAAFCAATKETFPRLCCEALWGTLPELRLHRLVLSLNGKPIPQHALNDVLIVHEDPATMSRYRLRIGGRQEAQKSSGLWVATAAGSSSAVLAAGGVQLAWGARRFQYRPRELYRGRLSQSRLTGGVLVPPTEVGVIWLMRRGCAFIDGPHVKIPLRFADELRVRLSLNDPVRVLGLCSK